MYHKQKSEIVIDADPQEIWEYASDPVNWTASNPKEHFGLKYDNEDNIPREDVEFHQDEEVAGIRNNLYGRFQYLDIPNVAVWAGTAYYPILGGLVKLRIPEGGTIKLESTEDGKTRMSHKVFMDFPNTRIGKIFYWYFKNRLKGPSKLEKHNSNELKYFKEHLEK